MLSQDIIDLASIHIKFKKNPVLQDFMVYTVPELVKMDYSKENLDLL